MALINVDTSAYDKLYDDYVKSVDEDVRRQKSEALAKQQNDLRQAYIQNQQNQLTLDKNLAMAGIRGGMTESANLKLTNQYGNNRNLINSTYSGNVRDIENTANSNKLAYKQNIDSARQQFIENRDQIEYQRKQDMYQKRTDRLTAKYAKVYSRKALKNALKHASSPLERQIINARIAYLLQHKKKY